MIINNNNKILNQFFLLNSSKLIIIYLKLIYLFKFILSAQALIAPFPPLEYSLLDGVNDDESILILQEHLRKRMEERQRLNIVNIKFVDKFYLKNICIFLLAYSRTTRIFT